MYTSLTYTHTHTHHAHTHAHTHAHLRLIKAGFFRVAEGAGLRGLTHLFFVVGHVIIVVRPQTISSLDRVQGVSLRMCIMLLVST